MKRNLDGYFMLIKRGDKFESVCLSDMTKEELEDVLATKSAETLRFLVIHLATVIHEIGEKFDLGRRIE